MANGPLAKISQIWLWDTLGQEGVAVGIDHREHSAQEAQWLLDEKPKPFFFFGPLDLIWPQASKKGSNREGSRAATERTAPRRLLC